MLNELLPYLGESKYDLLCKYQNPHLGDNKVNLNNQYDPDIH